MLAGTEGTGESRGKAMLAVPVFRSVWLECGGGRRPHWPVWPRETACPGPEHGEEPGADAPGAAEGPPLQQHKFREVSPLLVQDVAAPCFFLVNAEGTTLLTRPLTSRQLCKTESTWECLLP